MKCTSTDLWQELRFLFTSTPVEAPLLEIKEFKKPTWINVTVIEVLSVNYSPQLLHKHQVLFFFFNPPVTNVQTELHGV